MEFNLNTKDPYASLKIKDFRLFISARFLLTIAIQMQSVVVGWQIYELTHDALSLGLIGVSEALPFLCVALFAGHAADRVNRKSIIISSNLIYLVCTLFLLLVSTSLHHTLAIFGVVPIYSIILITGLAQGFMSPAQSAL